MPRTTLAIEPGLLRELKQRAARKDTTLQALVNDLLRQALLATPRKKYRFKLDGWDGVLQPGVDIADRNSLFRAMEGR